MRPYRIAMGIAVAVSLLVVEASALPPLDFGTVIRPTPVEGSYAPLRSSLPGFLGLYGRKEGTTDDFHMYLILDEQKTPSLPTYDRWVKVAPIVDSENDSIIKPNDAYWVYWGDWNSDSSENFEIIPPENVSNELSAAITLLTRELMSSR